MLFSSNFRLFFYANLIYRSRAVILKRSLKRLNRLNIKKMEALYDEYIECVNVDDYNFINDEVLYCNYLGKKNNLFG